MIVVCFVGLIYAYNKEECGDIKTLILVYLVVVSIGLGFLLFFCLLSKCFSRIQVEGIVAEQNAIDYDMQEKKNENKNYEQFENENE